MHWLLLKYSRKKLTLVVREITCGVRLIPEIGTDYLPPYTHMYIHTHISWVHYLFNDGLNMKLVINNIGLWYTISS